MGYFVASVIIYINTVNLLLIAESLFTVVLGGVLFGSAVVNDLKNYLSEINERGKLNENHLQATEQLSDFIKLHSLMKQLSKRLFNFFI